MFKFINKKGYIRRVVCCMSSHDFFFFAPSTSIVCTREDEQRGICDRGDRG